MKLVLKLKMSLIPNEYTHRNVNLRHYCVSTVRISDSQVPYRPSSASEIVLVAV